MRVLIAGEGRFELGGFHVEPSYRAEAPECGVVEAMLRRVAQRDFCVANGVPWKNIRKFKIGRSPEAADAQCVLGLAQLAKDSGYDAIAFVRDRDRSEERGTHVDDAIAVAERRFGVTLAIVGGVARECTDAWVLAWDGRRGTESMSVAAAKAARTQAFLTTSDAAAMIGRAEPDAIPDDAPRLRAWLDVARRVLAAAPDGGAGR